MKEPIDEAYSEYLKSAKAIKKYCEGKSVRSCDKGLCKFSDNEKRCIFNVNGQDFPFNWNLGGKKK